MTLFPTSSSKGYIVSGDALCQYQGSSFTLVPLLCLTKHLKLIKHWRRQKQNRTEIQLREIESQGGTDSWVAVSHRSPHLRLHGSVVVGAAQHGTLLCQLKSASTWLKVAGSGVQKHAKADVALPCLMDLLWCLTFCVKNRWRRRGHGTKGDSVREGRVSLKRPGWGRRALGLHRNPATAGFVGYQDTRGQGAHTRGRFQRI